MDVELKCTTPVPSMYAIFSCIWLMFMLNVGEYSIHGYLSVTYNTFRCLMFQEVICHSPLTYQVRSPSARNIILRSTEMCSSARNIILRSTEMCSSARNIMLRSIEDVFMCNECRKVKMDDLPRPLSGGTPNNNNNNNNNNNKKKKSLQSEYSFSVLNWVKGATARDIWLVV